MYSYFAFAFKVCKYDAMGENISSEKRDHAI